MSHLLLSARFFTTATKLSHLPKSNEPEVAFVGRSNSGKSSAINILCQRQRHRLAYSSKTPGRTQALNYFALGQKDCIEAYLVDTPGYGYASAPNQTIQSWSGLAGKYLAERSCLVSIVLLIDIRRGLKPLDQTLLNLVRKQASIMLLLTKADTLSRTEQRKSMSSVEKSLTSMSLPNAIHLLYFSATHSIGVEAGRSFIEEALQEAPT